MFIDHSLFNGEDVILAFLFRVRFLFKKVEKVSGITEGKIFVSRSCSGFAPCSRYYTVFDINEGRTQVFCSLSSRGGHCAVSNLDDIPGSVCFTTTRSKDLIGNKHLPRVGCCCPG